MADTLDCAMHGCSGVCWCALSERRQGAYMFKFRRLLLVSYDLRVNTPQHGVLAVISVW